MKKIIYTFLLLFVSQFGNSQMIINSYNFNEILSRVNFGGSEITATDGEINWQSGSGTSGTGWSVSGGATSTFPGTITWTRDASIPASIPDADFQTLYDSARQTNASMTFTYTVANGDYLINILTAEYAQDFQTPTNIDVTIQGSLVLDNANLNTVFGGFRDAGSLSFTATVSGGTLTIVLTRNSGSVNLYLNGIQITKID